MTRASHTFPATASARTIRSAKTPARVSKTGTRQIGMRKGADANANANALVTRCAFH